MIARKRRRIVAEATEPSVFYAKIVAMFNLAISSIPDEDPVIQNAFVEDSEHQVQPDFLANDLPPCDHSTPRRPSTPRRKRSTLEAAELRGSPCARTKRLRQSHPDASQLQRSLEPIVEDQ